MYSLARFKKSKCDRTVMGRDAALLVCLILILFSLPAANASHGYQELEGTVTESLYQDEDGHWWVLEDEYRERGGGYVYEFDSSWNRVGNGIPLGDVESSQTRYPEDIEFETDRGNGSWWVLDDGNVKEFTADWNYTGNEVDLRESLRKPEREEVKDIRKIPNGSW